MRYALTNLYECDGTLPSPYFTAFSMSLKASTLRIHHPCLDCHAIRYKYVFVAFIVRSVDYVYSFLVGFRGPHEPTRSLHSILCSHFFLPQSPAQRLLCVRAPYLLLYHMFSCCKAYHPFGLALRTNGRLFDYEMVRKSPPRQWGCWRAGGGTATRLYRV